VDRAFHARCERKREQSEPSIEMALRALGTHRAWNDAIHLSNILANASKIAFVIASG